MTIIWCMVPDIWSVTEVFFCHSGLVFALLSPYEPRKSKFSTWFLRYGVQQRIFLSFRTIFLLFYPSNNPKNQNFEKMKKLPGDIIILHICTINGNHMMYGSWNMEHDRQNFSSFWTIFCTFIPWTTWKIKILKKWKHHLKILSLYTCVP